MRYISEQIVFQEVPNEISLALMIVGCPQQCSGCHSADTWSADQGQELNESIFKTLLSKYSAYISCVVFLGGEWHEPELVSLLSMAQASGYKTCLYTGLEEANVSPHLKAHLSYLKAGPYIKSRGPLSSATSNQIFRNLVTGQILNHHFVSKEGKNDSFNHPAS